MADIFKAEVENCISVFVKIFRIMSVISLSSKFLILFTTGYPSKWALLFHFLYPLVFCVFTHFLPRAKNLSVEMKQLLIVILSESVLLIIRKLSITLFEHRAIFCIISTSLLMTFQTTPFLSYKIVAIFSLKHIFEWYWLDHYVNGLEITSSPFVYIAMIAYMIMMMINTHYRRNKIGKLQKISDKLKGTNKNLQNLIETLQNGLVLLDQHFMLKNANIKAKELLDCQEDTLINNFQVHAFLNHKSVYDSIREQGNILLNQNFNLGKISVNERRIDVSMSKINWDTSFVYVILFNDVTDTILLETNKAQNECKTQLLRFIPHELNSPIVGICGYTEHLLKKLESGTLSDLKDHLNTIHQSSRLLRTLICNISDYTEIFSDVFRLHLSKTNIHRVIEEAKKMVKEQAKRQLLELVIRVDSYIPEQVTTDSDRLLQLLIIILTNSLKYTYKGKIEIIVTMLSNNKIRFEIADTGIGIPLERLESIKNHLSNPATGCFYFGLEMANKIALELGNHDLEVESENGTQVTFYLIVSNDEEVIPEPDASSASLEACEGSHWQELPLFAFDHRSFSILIVDDSEINRNILKMLFNSWNLTYLEARDGQQAVDIVTEYDRKGKPLKIVIMDIDMPVMNGWEATMLINQLFESENISHKPYIVGYSAFTAPSYIEESYRLGMITYIKKPAKAREIFQIIRNLLAS